MNNSENAAIEQNAIEKMFHATLRLVFIFFFFFFNNQRGVDSGKKKREREKKPAHKKRERISLIHFRQIGIRPSQKNDALFLLSGSPSRRRV